MVKTSKTKGYATNQDVVIGSNLFKIRKAKGISQDQLGKDIGVTFQQVQKYERGANRISASKLLEISKCLEVPILDFYDGLLEDQAPFLQDISKGALQLAIMIDESDNPELVKAIKKLLKSTG